MRKPRLHVLGALYHVTLRGNHRQDIFFKPEDRTLLNQTVAEVIQSAKDCKNKDRTPGVPTAAERDIKLHFNYP